MMTTRTLKRRCATNAPMCMEQPHAPNASVHIAWRLVIDATLFQQETDHRMGGTAKHITQHCEGGEPASIATSHCLRALCLCVAIATTQRVVYWWTRARRFSIYDRVTCA